MPDTVQKRETSPSFTMTRLQLLPTHLQQRRSAGPLDVQALPAGDLRALPAANLRALDRLMLVQGQEPLSKRRQVAGAAREVLTGFRSFIRPSGVGGISSAVGTSGAVGMKGAAGISGAAGMSGTAGMKGAGGSHATVSRHVSRGTIASPILSTIVGAITSSIVGSIASASTIIAVMGLCGLTSSALAQVPVAIAPPPDMATARRLLYGGAVWQDPRVNDFFGGGSRVSIRASVTEVWRQRYTDLSTEKLMVVYQLTPGPREQFQCAACVPALGAALFAADERGRWQLRARGPLLMEGAPGAGPEDLQLLQLADDRWALRSRRADSAAGWESRSERLVLEQGDQLRLALNEGFKDKPGPAACGSGAAPQATGLSVLSPGLGPRVEVVLRFNEGRCPRPDPRVQRQRLILRDGQFELEDPGQGSL
jgi:hypothetical protein